MRTNPQNCEFTQAKWASSTITINRISLPIPRMQIDASLPTTAPYSLTSGSINCTAETASTSVKCLICWRQE